MVPNASEIVRRRLTVRTVMRISAFYFALIGVFPLVSWIQEGLADGDLWDMSYYFERILFGAFFPVVSVIALLFQRLLVKFFVPIRRHVACPACGQRIEGLVEPRCTECGLLLTAEFLDPATPPELVRQGNSLVAARRETVAIVFRTIGVLVMMITGIVWLVFLLANALWLFGVEGADLYAESTKTLLSMFVWLCITVLGYVLLFRSRLLARIAVPALGKPHEPQRREEPQSESEPEC